jgi:RNA polymerase sigma-54 factor
MSTKITQSLQLKAAQQLVMTPQLQQAIKLLQMTNQELDLYLEDQLAHNPLLEKAEPERGDASLEEMAKPEGGDGDSIDRAFDENWGDDAAPPSTQAPSDFDAGTARVGAGGRSSFDSPDNPFGDTLTSERTLRDHLNDQLAQDMSDPTDRRIGALLIDMLDESGYLRVDDAELASRLGIAEDRLHAVLARLRQFDPAGIFARDLKDCLRLQLDDQNKLDEPFTKLLDHLGDIAAHDHRKLAQICGVNETFLRDMLAELKMLNPRPAGQFDHLVVQTAIPDVLMKTLPKSVGGGWRLELNSETLPRVLVNQVYFNDVLSHAKSDKDKTYLNTQMNDANWLVRALDQRAQTILKVASDIVERQNAFFLYGIEYLTPMTLKDVAETIAMHESTVSRVTTGKYIGTPRGIFELKFFFTTAIAGTDGSSHSAESVKVKIKTMIDAEDLDHVLSDDAIAEQLQKDGIDLARRTVAKYREAMHIPSSSERRKIKKNQD